MNKIYLNIILLFTVFAVALAQDYTVFTGNGIINGTSIVNLLSGIPPYKTPAIYIQATTSLINSSGSNLQNNTDEPLSISVGYWDEAANKTSYFRTITLNGTDSTTDYIIPCTYGYYGALNFSVIAYSLANTNSAYSISINVTYIATALTDRFWLGWGICPGARYFYYEIPDNDYAYNLTFASSADTAFNKWFNGLSVKLKGCPDNNVPSSQQANADRLNKDLGNGLTFNNLHPGGTYWVKLSCTNSSEIITGASNIDIQTSCKQTCNTLCFKHGICIENPPMCTCSTWWDGPNCETLYKGDYALIAVVSVMGLIFIFITTRIVLRCVRKKPYIYEDFDGEEEEDFGVMENSPSSSFTRESNPLLGKRRVN